MKEEIIDYSMYQVFKYPLLSKEETNDLFKQMEDATEEEKQKIKEKIILHNLRLPIFVASKFLDRGIEFEDLKEEGNIGLIDAVEKYRYDNEENASFSTFAFNNIKYNIRKYIRENSGLVRIPEHIRVFNHKYNEYKNRLSITLGREPTDEELSKELKVPLKIIYRCKKYDQPMTYLDEHITDKKKNATRTYLDIIPCEKDEENELLNRLLIEQIHKIFEDDEYCKRIGLKKKDIEIIKTRYGYYTNDVPQTYQEVSDAFGYSSKQTPRDAEHRAIKTLRKEFITLRNKQDFPIDKIDGYNTIK